MNNTHSPITRQLLGFGISFAAGITAFAASQVVIGLFLAAGGTGPAEDLTSSGLGALLLWVIAVAAASAAVLYLAYVIVMVIGFRSSRLGSPWLTILATLGLFICGLTLGVYGFGFTLFVGSAILGRLLAVAISALWRFPRSMNAQPIL